jgi:hypothetical protein
MAEVSQSPAAGASQQRREWTPADGSEAVQQYLAKILQSSSFQGSKRCQKFLQYAIEKTLAGQLSALKERVIGTEVFDRQPDYETSADAIVRVKANELRKRLAQYYQGPGAADALRIELPAGSYIPALTWQGEPSTPIGPVEHREASPSEQSLNVPAKRAGLLARAGRKVWLGLGVVALVAAGVAVSRMVVPQEEIERFWAPMFESSEPVVVCMSVRDDYIHSERVAEAFAAVGRNERTGLDFPLQPDDVVRIPSGQMSLPSLRAVLDLGMFLAQHGKRAQFRTPAEVSFDEIRHRAVVLVGSFYNPWATQLNQELRYHFASANTGSRAVSWIIDKKAPEGRKWVVDKVWPYHPQPVDYAIITRLFDSANQRVFVSAAGMTRFGAQVAGEFLTAGKYWKGVASQAPKGWERMNCQIVLETKLVGMTPGPPKIVAIHFW